MEGARHDGFVALIRTIESLLPRAPRIGGDHSPHEEPVFLRHKSAMSFDHADVQSVEAKGHRIDGSDGLMFEITTTFLGLAGTSSPLPSGLLMLLREDEPGGDVRRALLDIFHHRALSLFYRAVAQWDLPQEMRRLETSGRLESWPARLLALGGADAWGEARTPSLPTRLQVAPVLASGARWSAWALEAVLRIALADLLEGEAELAVEQFLPRTIQLEVQDLTRLGRAQSNSRLGGPGGIVLGRSIRFASRIAIHLGPVELGHYGALLPGGGRHEDIQRVLRLLGHETLAVTLVLILRPGQVPSFGLGRKSGRRLGRDTWLRGTSRRNTRVRVRLDLEDDPRGETPCA